MNEYMHGMTAAAKDKKRPPIYSYRPDLRRFDRIHGYFLSPPPSPHGWEAPIELFLIKFDLLHSRVKSLLTILENVAFAVRNQVSTNFFFFDFYNMAIFRFLCKEL